MLAQSLELIDTLLQVLVEADFLLLQLHIQAGHLGLGLGRHGWHIK